MSAGRADWGEEKSKTVYRLVRDADPAGEAGRWRAGTVKGPYGTPGAAKGEATRLNGHIETYWPDDPKWRVQVSVTEWRDVE